MIAAFDDLRVLDFTRGPGGWLATMLLADNGAEVIAIEPVEARRHHHEPGYIASHRNKQRTTLDLETAAGIAEARRLLATADVAVFDGAPGSLERLGLDATTLRVAHPGLLHVSMPFQGTVGRWSQLPAREALLQAVTGFAWMQHTYADQPMWMVTPQLSYGHGLIGAAAIAASLVERQRSGLGQALTVSGLHAFAGTEAGAVRAPEVMRIGGNDSRGGVPNYRLYQCADSEWFFLATLTPAFFLRALEATEMLDLLMLEGVDGEFTNLLRPPHNRVAIEHLDARFLERSREEWLTLLHEHGVPAGPVGRRDDWFASDVVRANGMRVEFEHPGLGHVAIPGHPVRFGDTPATVRGLATDIAAADIPARELSLAAEGEPRPGGPLAGTVVLDFGQVIAGTYPSSILANFGADVIKVEGPNGDIFRPYGLGFIGWNRGKRGIVVDLKHDDGRDALHELVRSADLVIDNFRDGVTGRLGLDFGTLSRLNERIITCSITGYGPDGPMAKEPGFDPLLQAASGIMAHQGGADEPIFHQIPVNDTGAGMTAAFAAATALYSRGRTGRGQEVKTSLANVSVICQLAEITELPGREPAPEGGLDCTGIAALRRYYRCADGWVALDCDEPAHFPALCTALGQPIWAARRLAEDALAEPRDGELASLVAEALTAIPRDEAVDRLQRHGVPCAPVMPSSGIYDDPWLRANQHWSDFEDPNFGAMTGVRAFAAWSRTGAGFARGAPQLGEHTREVFAAAGLPADRIAALLEAGAIVQFEPA